MPRSKPRRGVVVDNLGSVSTETFTEAFASAQVSLPSINVSYTPAPIAVPPPPNPSVLGDTTTPKKKKSEKHGMSVQMEEFCQLQDDFLNDIIATGTDPLINELCTCDGALRTIRCLDCRFSSPTCAACFLNNHVLSPHHWAEVWSLDHFQHTDYSALGGVVTLGHHGQRCPHLQYSAKSSVLDFILVEVNGIHSTKIAFCACPVSHDKSRQLLQHRIFPATTKHPQLGFSFDVLNDFHLHTLTSKKLSAYDYLQALQRKTNEAFPHKVSFPINQFRRVGRLWRVWSMIQRSGQLRVYDIDRHFPFRQEGTCLTACLSCPEPGFNVPLEVDDKDYDPEFVHLFTQFDSMDGHFGLQRKSKVDDPDDISLLGPAGLFPSDEPYKKYLSAVVPQSEEKSTCSRFNAIEMQNKLKFKGCVISGVVGVQCARHSVFRSVVDLDKGEKFAHGDYAYYLALLRMVAQAVHRAKFFRRIVLTYDIACQFWIHMAQRFRTQFPHLSDVIDLVKLLVPKLHLDGHKPDCKYRYSLDYTEGCGRLDGEGIERSWAEQKGCGLSTREMNHGHRHDILTDFMDFWNLCRNQSMPQLLYKKLTNARGTSKRMISTFLGRSKRAGQGRVNEWESLPTQPTQVDGEWTSVYRFSSGKLPSQESMFKSLLQQSEQRESSTDRRIHGEGPHLVNSGLKIQSKQRSLLKLVKAKETSAEDIDSQRSRLRQDIKAFRTKQNSLQPQLSPLISAEPFQEPEVERLFLPSDLSPGLRAQYSLHEFAKMETKLREGEAIDAICDVRHSIRHTKILVTTKKKQSSGVKMNLRSVKYIRGVREKRDSWAAKYNNARRCLLSLIGPHADEAFPELKEEDMYIQNIVEDRALGEGTLHEGWIWDWGYGLDKDSEITQQEYDLEADRVRWFRARANMRRWVEEVELLEEEFRRYIRGCYAMVDTWQTLAEKAVLRHPSLPGYFVFANKQSRVYREMAIDARALFEKAGGQFPRFDESLIAYARRRRPCMTVDWAAMDVDSTAVPGKTELVVVDESGEISDVASVDETEDDVT